MFKQFFEEMFPQNDTYKLIWTLSDKKSHWFKKIDTLIEFVQHKKQDVYFGIGTSTKQLPSYKRAVAQDIFSLRGMHMDIDTQASIAHKHNGRLPATKEEALAIAHAVLPPTYVVDSGYGLHVYWMCDEHQVIDNHEFWRLFIQAWQQAHRDLFPQYDIDATHDLARVMRCPGSINCKDPEHPVQCSIIEHNPTAYYTTDQFEDVIGFDFEETIARQPSLPPAKSIDTDTNTNTGSDKPKSLSTKFKRLTVAECHQYIRDNNLTISVDNPLGADEFATLSCTVPDFINEFNNTTGRKGPSEYQMRLINIGIDTGLTDQKILDLMVQHRRFKNHDLQLHRVDKYINDLLGARYYKKIDKIVKTPTKKITPTDLEEIRNYIYSKIGIEVICMWRYDKSPNSYFEIELATKPGEPIYLGSWTEGVLNQNAFDGKVIAEGNGASPRKVSGAMWYNDIQTKLRMLTVEGVSPDTATYSGQARVWTKEWFSVRPIHSSMDEYIKDGLPNSPFFHNGRVYFQYETLSQWVKTNKGETIDTFQFCIALSKHGFFQEQFNGISNVRTTCWVSPPGYVTPKQPEPIEPTEEVE